MTKYHKKLFGPVLFMVELSFKTPKPTKKTLWSQDFFSKEFLKDVNFKEMGEYFHFNLICIKFHKDRPFLNKSLHVNSGNDDHFLYPGQGLSQQGVFLAPWSTKNTYFWGKRHPIFWSEFFESINYK